MRNWFRRKPPGIAPDAPPAAAPVAPHKKLAIVSVHDYPRTTFSAYWELGVSNTEPHRWLARLISVDTGEDLAVGSGVAESEQEARRASQQWVLDRIEAYRRPEALP